MITPITAEAFVKAVEESETRNRATSNLLDFTKYTFPGYKADPFHAHVAKHLDKVISGGIKKLMIFAPPQHGKLLSHDTQIPTPDGWRNHGDIRCGDFVYGRTGKPVLVIATSDEGIADYIVKFSDGGKVKCHGNHEWIVFDRNTHGFDERILTTQEINNLGVRLGDRKRGGRGRFQIDTNTLIEYSEKNLPIHPYVLGAWLGDGSTNKNCITHSADDVSVIHKIESLGLKRTAIWKHKETGVLTSYFCDLYGLLVKSKLLGRKIIPREYVQSSIEQRLELLAGLIDTDGYVYPKNGRVVFSNTNKDIIDGISEIIRSLGWRISTYKCNPTLSSSGIQGRQVTYQIGFNPTIPIPMTIPRKTGHKITPKIRKRSIVSIEKCDPVPGKCIQVEGGVYLIGETFIPTHNSELVSVRFPAYWFGKRPDDPIILTSYGAALAETKSKQARQVVESKEYAKLFQGIETNRDSRATYRWEISGKRGSLLAAGVAGPIAGHGAAGGLVDDPIENYQASQSKIILDTCWEWYRTTFRPRIWENGSIILITTRWCQDDLAGRLMQEQPGEWTVIRYPAIAETQEERDESNRLLGLPQGEADPLGRGPGEPLCPSRFSIETLEAIKRDIGSMAWYSLYQGTPRAPEGNRFKRSWFQIVQKCPYKARRVRFWDKAASEGTGDYTAGVLIAFADDGLMYIEDLVHGQWSSGNRDVKIKETADRDSVRYNNSVIIWGEQEPGSGGKDSAQAFVRMLIGHPAFSEKVTGSKEVRAEPFASFAEQGRVRLVAAPWNAIWLDEICSFPQGSHDDIVDATAGAFNKLTKGSRTGISQFRIYQTGTKKRKYPRLILCSHEQLKEINTDDPALVICLSDPEPLGLRNVPPHVLPKLIDSVNLRFVDLDPDSGECEDWEQIVRPYGKKAEDLIFSKEMGKQIWSMIQTKGKDARILVFTDDGWGGDRRAETMAMAICDVLGFPRNEAIYKWGEEEWKIDSKAPPKNKRLFSLCKSSRSLVI